MEIPKNTSKKIDKVIVNVGVGSMRDKRSFEDKVLPEIEEELKLITGQKPSRRPAKKSEAGFNVRQGDIVGLKVSLRGKRMVDFLSRLINIALPRVRDFKGIELRKIDEGGNLNIGFKDRQVFPEVNVEESNVDFGLQVTVVPKTKDKEEAIDLYRSIGVPLKGKNK